MLDRVELIVKAGDGGDGAISFRREKFVPFGGPDGGDGGKGADVILRVDDSINTLQAYRHKRVFRAAAGGKGMGKKRHGKNGEPLVLTVPAGTLVWYKNEGSENELIGDLIKSGQSMIVAKGGRGGWGNVHYKSSTNQAPRIAGEGRPGEELTLILELRLIADVGIIGYPNVGKSSLLAAVSAAKPRIADYPFTTLEPILGLVQKDHKSFVIAEIPGLIEGAHAGKGLGHDFLRHAMRTRILIHLLDGSSQSPVEDFVNVNRELELFDPALAKKPQLVAINKIDKPEVSTRLKQINNDFTEICIQPCFISAATREGIPELISKTWKILQSLPAKLLVEKQPEKIKVFRPKPVG